MRISKVCLLLTFLMAFLLDTILGVEPPLTSPDLPSLVLCLLTLSEVTLGNVHGSWAVTRRVVQVGSDVILPCSLSTNGSIVSDLFDWKKVTQKHQRQKEEVFMYDAGVHYNNGRDGQDEQFRGRVSYFPGELKNGNASIIIRNAKTADSGNYTCAFPRHRPLQISNVELFVGAAPEPDVSIVDVTKSGVWLKCAVRGAFPVPKLRWLNADGDLLRAEEPRVSPRGDRYDVSLNAAATSTPTNLFRCVATQEDIGHEIGANITVPEKLFRDTSCKLDVTGGVVGALFGAAAVLVAQAFLQARKAAIKRRNKEFMQRYDLSPSSS